jgi:hypothetical protein
MGTSKKQNKKKNIFPFSEISQIFFNDFMMIFFQKR